MADQVILAFSFGSPCWLKSNQVIAKKTVILAKILNADIFTMKDILINKEFAHYHHVEYAENIINNGVNKKYLSTLGLIRCFARYAKGKVWEKVWVIAAPQHIGRCLRDLEKTLKKENLRIEILIGNDADYDEEFWYFKDSTQRCTRSPFIWWLREIPLRLLPWWLYKKIA